jgi:hypothetical protein
VVKLHTQPLPSPQLLMLFCSSTEANAWTSAPGRTVLGVFFLQAAVNQARRGPRLARGHGALLPCFVLGARGVPLRLIGARGALPPVPWEQRFPLPSLAPFQTPIKSQNAL